MNLNTVNITGVIVWNSDNKPFRRRMLTFPATFCSENCEWTWKYGFKADFCIAWIDTNGCKVMLYSGMLAFDIACGGPCRSVYIE